MALPTLTEYQHVMHQISILMAGILLLCYFDEIIRSSQSESLSAGSYLLRLDIIVVLVLLAYQTFRILYSRMTAFAALSAEESWLCGLNLMANMGLALATIPVVFHHSWVEFAQLTMGQLSAPILGLFFIYVNSIIVNIDINNHRPYSWLMGIVCWLLLMVYCVVVLLTDFFIGQVFPYAFIAPEKWHKFWIFPIILTAVFWFVFMVQRLGCLVIYKSERVTWHNWVSCVRYKSRATSVSLTAETDVFVVDSD